MNTPTLRHMQYLIALAETGNFSRAAENCFVTQSTLSAGIKEMESILGTPLVERGRGGATLTALGEDMRDQSVKILSAAHTMTERANHYAKPMSGPLRLGIIPTIAPYLLPRILPMIEREFPDLELQIHEDMSHRISADLQAGKLDMILLAFPFETPGATQFPLFTEEFYLACPEDKVPEAMQAHISDLVPDELLLLADGHCLADHALQACKLQRGSTRRTYSASSLNTLVQMVGAGYGFTLIPQMMLNAGPLPNGVVSVFFCPPPPTRDIGLAWRENNARAEDFEKLAELIKDVNRD